MYTKQFDIFTVDRGFIYVSTTKSYIDVNAVSRVEIEYHSTGLKRSENTPWYPEAHIYLHNTNEPIKILLTDCSDREQREAHNKASRFHIDPLMEDIKQDRQSKYKTKSYG